MFRARLSVFQLESRDNPSTPELDPLGLGAFAPPPSDPPSPPPSNPAISFFVDAAAATAARMTVGITTITADPFTEINTIYNVPLVP